MVAPSWCLFGNSTPQNEQGENSFSFDTPWGTCMGLVDVLKTKDTQPPWNLHMEGVQVVVEQKVHVTPLGVQRWDGVLWIHPRRRTKLLGPLCAKLQLNVDNDLFEKWVYQEVGLFTRVEALGSNNYLSKYEHLKHLLGLNEDGGVHGRRRPFAPQGSNWKWNHP